MATIKPESKMLEEVRRWRREVYEERLGMTFEQRAEEDRRLAEELGLRTVRPEDLIKPTTVPSKQAG